MIELTNLTKVYGAGTASVKALTDISLTVNQGEFVAVMGTSGSGKSTLLNIIGCLDTATSGTYKLEDKDVAKLNIKDKARIRNEVFGFVFQAFNLLPENTALENVILPLKYSFVPKSKWTTKASEALEKMGIVDLANRYPDQLSGGQQQRVAIARALVNDPKVILADEPTGNLDSTTSKEIVSVLRNLVNNQEKSVIIVTHDGKIASHAQRLLQMVDGKIIDDSSIDNTAVSFSHPSV